MSKPSSCAEAALDELCVRYGYCLSDDVIERLLDEPPDNPDQFTDAVLVGEGLDPAVIDKRAREQVRVTFPRTLAQATLRQTQHAMRLPKWAQWQAENPPTGIDPGVNRRFWRVIAWEVRFWLAFAAFMVLLAVVLLIVLLVEAA